jgi:hypothetical protein
VQLEAFSHFTLAPIAGWRPTTRFDSGCTEEHFIPFHYVADFENSLVNARSVTTSNL